MYKRHKKIISCSIGVCVYNEERNIKRFIDSLLKQKLKNVKIKEIIVIASGSTDKTLSIVKKISKRNKLIKIIYKKKREGKATAVNMFIEKASSEILVLMGGDIILAPDTVQELVGKFFNNEVGMTGVRPIPINDVDSGLFGYASHLLWELHHRVSLQDPKMGEVVAFRKIFRKIPTISSVDEANIEPLIRGQGYKIVYVPEAKAYNKGPTNIRDFIKQRRRIFSGHLAVKYEQSYQVATMNILPIFRVLLSFLKENPRPKFILYTPLVILLEIYSRFLGWWDYKVLKFRYSAWETISSTKNLSQVKLGTLIKKRS